MISTFRLRVGIKPERLARILLAIAPPDATPWELVHIAATRWDDLADHELGSVVTLAREIRGEVAA